MLLLLSLYCTLEHGGTDTTGGTADRANGETSDVDGVNATDYPIASCIGSKIFTKVDQKRSALGLDRFHLNIIIFSWPYFNFVLLEQIFVTSVDVASKKMTMVVVFRMLFLFLEKMQWLALWALG